jgi:hypothetical protein
MDFLRSKYHRWNTCVAWVILWAVLCCGMFPPMELCLCEDCSCPANISKWQKTNTDPPVRQGTCCQTENRQPPGSAKTHQSRCSSGTTGQCHCSKGTLVRIAAVRTSSTHQQRDNVVEKSFDTPAWKVVRGLPSLAKNAIDIGRSQYAPHVLLPRLHLLLSVFLN